MHHVCWVGLIWLKRPRTSSVLRLSGRAVTSYRTGTFLTPSSPTGVCCERFYGNSDVNSSGLRNALRWNLLPSIINAQEFMYTGESSHDARRNGPSAAALQLCNCYRLIHLPEHFSDVRRNLLPEAPIIKPNLRPAIGWNNPQKHVNAHKPDLTPTRWSEKHQDEASARLRQTLVYKILSDALR